QPDLHRSHPNIKERLRVCRGSLIGLVGDCVERVIVPAREVHGMTAGNRCRGALIECQRLLWLAAASTVAKEAASVLARGEIIEVVRRLGIAGVDPRSLQHL